MELLLFRLRSHPVYAHRIDGACHAYLVCSHTTNPYTWHCVYRLPATWHDFSWRERDGRSTHRSHYQDGQSFLLNLLMEAQRLLCLLTAGHMQLIQTPRNLPKKWEGLAVRKRIFNAVAKCQDADIPALPHLRVHCCIIDFSALRVYLIKDTLRTDISRSYPVCTAVTWNTSR